ncbi:ABC transporter substrate-binding protein [Methanocaldococcus fervens]|uniref:Periplasmic binding protein n=1 Tax=Methanocaldococcus fervens (strain DSM 4213 / JCM 15782 / AG86) TaxID=573064 RepID=C7P8R7_METFA|nr:ABC transporter substrate-binding protein [Methanocaldococcus fervens]ACV24949.1 periplasmic binding protein [Methanocaldococcus fervens AG86]
MKKIILLLLILGVVVAFAGCVEENKTTQTYNISKNVVKYAKTFKLEPHWEDGYCIVVDSKGKMFVFVEENAKAPNIPNAIVLNVPVKKVVTVFYCPVISTADILNESICYESIKGVPKTYISYSPVLSQYYKEGKVVDIGKSSKIDYDKIVNISPDIVFLGDWPSHDEMEVKLNELGITTARFFTYDEPTFMGRVEWIKFAAAFYGSDIYKKADAWFKNVEKEREDILKKIEDVKTESIVASFSWSKSKQMAVIYGNNHYYSKMIAELKGKYLFADYNGTKSYYLDKETFYERAINADVVIMRNYYGDEIKTKEDLLKLNPDFANFKALKNERFYVSHTDYYVWEARDPIGYMMDYAKMIHPELFGGDEDLKYFYKIK